MTTLTPPRPTSSPSTRVRRRSRGLTTVGAVLTAVGLLAGTVAAAVLFAFGSGSRLDSGPQSFTTPTAALVTDSASMDDVRGIATVTGRPTVQVSSQTANPAGVFIGVGPADAVDAYLAGIAVDEVTDLSFDPFRLTVTARAGDATAAPPGQQDLWVASVTSSSRAELTWPIQDGEYRLVVMNADGSPDVVTQTRVQIDLPRVFAVSLGVLIGSGLVAAGGVALLVAGLRRGSVPTPEPGARP
ncbi:hypothetical protein ACI8AF_18205 [Blastococcus sp. SYSU D00669]